MLCVEQLAQQDRSSISVEPQHTPTSGEESEWKVFGCMGVGEKLVLQEYVVQPKLEML